MRLRDAAFVVAASLLVAIVGAFALDVLQPAAELWRYGLEGMPCWPGDSSVFGAHLFTAWVVGGLVPSLVTSLILTSNARRWMRALAAGFGICCLAILVFLVGFKPDEAPWPWVQVAVVAIASVAAGFVTFRRRVPRPTTTRRRLVIVAVATSGALALGIPTIVRTYDEYRDQRFRTFTLELVAAYPTNEPSADGVEIIEHDGVRYRIAREDRLFISSADVRRVRLVDGGLTIRFGRRIHAALAARSYARTFQHDALYVDGELVLVPVYNTALVETIFITDAPDRVRLRQLHDRLVAPSRP